jgi:hypothetical protein
MSERRVRAASTGWLPTVVVFIVALWTRLLVPLTSRGLVANYSYDASVYYSAGAALIHGRVPYREFILLHPPGVMLTVAPSAWIGRLTDDQTGFAVAALQFMLFGAASAALVVVIAHRLGAGWWAATAGGLFYAAWLPSIRSEYVSRLEPLGNLLVLCGLLAYAGIDGPRTRRSAVLCGVALGAAASVKIWYAALLAVVLCFLVARRLPRDAVRVLGGSVATIVLVYGPFFALAPSDMWRMVVTEQVGRQPTNPLRGLILLDPLPPELSWQTAWRIVAVLVAAVAALLVAAWRAPILRLPAALLLTSGGLILAAPSWFVSYLDFVAPAAALCVATGAAAIGAARTRTDRQVLRAVAAAGALVALSVLVVPADWLWYGRAGPSASLPSPELASAVSEVRCVVSDSPMALIGLNALHRGLANGCANWIDVTGRTYASDMEVRSRDGRRVSRIENRRWQRALLDYLSAGDALIVVRGDAAGISPSTWSAIRRGGIVATDGTHVVYGVREGSS